MCMGCMSGIASDMTRFSLQQCHQAYAHMDITLKRALPEKLAAIAPEYGLSELSYPSCTRAFGFHLSSLSAADAVEGLSALLEAATGVRMEIDKEGGKNGGEWFGGTRLWNVGGVAGTTGSSGKEGKENVDPKRKDAAAAVGGDMPDTQLEPRKPEAWHVANFWVAYDACDESVGTCYALLGRFAEMSLAVSPYCGGHYRWPCLYTNRSSARDLHCSIKTSSAR